VHQDRAPAAWTGQALPLPTRPRRLIEANVPDLPRWQAVRTVEIRERVALYPVRVRTWRKDG
jgi:hypothetical protein